MNDIFLYILSKGSPMYPSRITLLLMLILLSFSVQAIVPDFSTLAPPPLIPDFPNVNLPEPGWETTLTRTTAEYVEFTLLYHLQGFKENLTSQEKARLLNCEAHLKLFTATRIAESKNNSIAESMQLLEQYLADKNPNNFSTSLTFIVNGTVPDTSEYCEKPFQLKYLQTVEGMIEIVEPEEIAKKEQKYARIIPPPHQEKPVNLDLPQANQEIETPPNLPTEDLELNQIFEQQPLTMNNPANYEEGDSNSFGEEEQDALSEEPVTIKNKSFFTLALIVGSLLCLFIAGGLLFFYFYTHKFPEEDMQYVQDQLEQGKTKDQIGKNLLQAGWENDQIENILKRF